MRKEAQPVAELTPLNVPVPTMLAKAIGYTGEARFVSFQWTPFGDETDYSLKISPLLLEGLEEDFIVVI
jgi:hypothetical protein